jgi:hypothetical protein
MERLSVNNDQLTMINDQLLAGEGESIEVALHLLPAIKYLTLLIVKGTIKNVKELF